MTIAIPTTSIRAVKREWFVENQQTDLATGQTITTQQAKRDYLPIGVSKIQYKEGRDYLVTISAKTLGQDYLEGINLNTWDRSLEGLSPIMNIDINSLWDENPKIHRCDNTDNILLTDIGYKKNEICRSLYTAKRNERFIPKWYETKKTLGVEFFGTQQEKNRLIIYDKRLDLEKAQNEEFRKSIPNIAKMYAEAEKTLRFETNHTSFRSMKDRFKVSQNNLQEMLNSQSKVNYNYLNKVLKFDFRQATIWDELKTFEGSGAEYIKFLGIKAVAEKCNYETTSIRLFLKEAYGERKFKYLWSQTKYEMTLKDMITKLQIENEKQKGNLEADTKPLTICNSVLEALKLAV